MLVQGKGISGDGNSMIKDLGACNCMQNLGKCKCFSMVGTIVCETRKRPGKMGGGGNNEVMEDLRPGREA